MLNVQLISGSMLAPVTKQATGKAERRVVDTFLSGRAWLKEKQMAIEHPHGVAGVARGALELVCTGEKLDDAASYYSEHFLDHVNAREYQGLDGVRRSVALYQQLFEKLRLEVLQQVTEGDSVASRFVIHGVHRGRRVRVPGIVISRIEDGRIVEDFAAVDTLEILRQLGIWRTLLFAATHPRALKH